MGQEDRRGAQQGRPAEDAGEPGQGEGLRPRARRQDAGCRPGGARGVRARGARGARAGRRRGPRSERVARLRAQGHGDARRGGALPAQAAEPARRRAPGSRRGEVPRRRAARRCCQGDLAALDAIEARVAGGSAELVRDFGFRLSDVEKVLLDFERRGNAFFDERLRLGRFRELFDRERLRRDFEAEAVGGAALRGGAPRGRRRGLHGRGGAAPVAGRDGAPGGAQGRGPGCCGTRGRPLRLRSLAAARERARGGPLGRRALRRAGRGAPAGREGARVGGAGRAAAGLGARPRHDRGRAREHHRRRRHRHPRRGGALADRPVPAARAA